MDRCFPPEWFKKRNYLHFDTPPSFEKIFELVTNPDLVTQHAFYPFIKDQIVSRKARLTTEGILRSTKIRDICYASHFDSHIYSYYSALLSSEYENYLIQTKMSNCVLAFRKIKDEKGNSSKCNIDFAYQAFKDIKAYKTCHIIIIDIKGFFDNLDHGILKKKWMDLLNLSSHLPPDHYNIYKSLTKFSHISKEKIHSTLSLSKNNHRNLRPFRYCSASDFRTKIRASAEIITNRKSFGIPQGSPISGLLSNIYLMDFDKCFYEIMAKYNGKYYRYCDDMIFIVPENSFDLRKQVEQELKDIKLDISVEKTQEHFFRDGKLNKPLQYLGFIFDGEKIYLRSKGISTYLRKMRKAIHLALATRKKYNKKNSVKTKLHKRKLNIRYSYKGKRNFIKYGLRAAKIMDSSSIRKQIKRLGKKLNQEIDKTK